MKRIAINIIVNVCYSPSIFEFDIYLMPFYLNLVVGSNDLSMIFFVSLLFMNLF